MQATNISARPPGHASRCKALINGRASRPNQAACNALEVYDSSLNNSFSDNAVIYTPNAKVLRNSFAGAGAGWDGTAATASVSGDNIRFGGVDIVIADNIIQQAAGWGVDLVSARSVRIDGNFFDNNGRMIVMTTGTAGPLGTGALRLFKSGHVTVCGNTFSESASAFENDVSATPIAAAAHVTFSGNSDTVAFCGNVYLPIATSASNGTSGSSLSSVLIHPDFDYDAVDADGTLPVLTNITIADNAAPQNIGVFSPGAAQAVAGQNVTPVPNYTNGLLLSYGPTTTVNIAPGRATDSTAASVILLPVQCTITSTMIGAGGLDVVGGLAKNATYNVFVISGPGGSNPSCIASLNTVPSFLKAGAYYSLSTQGMTVAGSPMIYNVGQTVTTNPDGSMHYSGPNNLTMNPLAGMAVGDLITGMNIPDTTIASLPAFNANNITTNISGSATDCIKLPNITSATTLVGFNIAGPSILPSTYIDSAAATCTLNHFHYHLSQPPAGPVNSVNIAIGGNFTITTVAKALTTSSLGPPFAPSLLTVYVGLYRSVGQFATDGSGNIKSF